MLPPCGQLEAQGCCRSWQDMSSPNSLFERAKRPRATLMNLDSGTRLTVSIAGLGHIRFGADGNVTLVGGDLACREAATHRAGDVQHHPQTARTESDPSLRWPLADSHRPLRRCWFHHGNDRAKGRKHVPASTASSSLRHLRSDRRRPRRARKHRARQRTLGASRPSEKAQARHSELSSSPSSHGKAAQCGLSRFGAGRPRVPLWLRLVHVLPPIVVSRAVLRP